MPTLRQLHEAHSGKVSDKWTLYLDAYDRVLRELRDRPVRLLEIGVQNGGSLEVWARYFPAATRFVGCDIDPACAGLSFDDSRIFVVVGDANLDETARRIAAYGNAFDVIIDDGSHRSSDIVRSFARWFPQLVDGGVYIVEDLHCSYWRSYEGGLHDPLSSISFMKALGDVVAHEHWGLDRTRRRELLAFEQRYGVALDEHVLERVHSVELMNSMAIVRKAAPGSNVLGPRVVSGRDASVNRIPVDAHDTRSTSARQEDEGTFLEQMARAHEYATTLEGETATLRRALGVRTEELVEREATLGELEAKIGALEAKIGELVRERALVVESTSWWLTRPLRAASKRLLGHWRERG